MAELETVMQLCLGLIVAATMLIAAGASHAQDRFRDLRQTPMIQQAQKQDTCCCQEGQPGRYTNQLKRRDDCKAANGKCIAKEACH
ncbi:MAG: hypothetical protein WCP68_00655 [Enhydrobacter sp.]